MKRRSFDQRWVRVFAFASLFGTLLAFWGCNKTPSLLSNGRPLPETNVRLVPESVSRSIAINFNADSFYGANKGTNHYPYKSVLHGNNVIKNSFVWNDGWGKPAVYIYDFANQGGFLLVSADSALCPVLAFIERGEYRNETLPAGVNQWAKKTMSNIALVRAGLYKPNTPAGAWGDIAGSATSGRNAKTPTGTPGGPPPHCTITNASSVLSVGPFLATTWGQQCTYNELCGAFGVTYSCSDLLSCSDRPPTGCVATAVAQIIYYWQPANTFNYNYASMPLDYGNTEVEKLMRDAGAMVNTVYRCAVAHGSSANETAVPPALIFNFGFSSATEASYDYNTVVNDITINQYPVLLSGQDTEAHEWVCDGYTSTTYTYTSSCNPGIVYYAGAGNILFHMNWGWHEVVVANDYNGWFSVTNWTIAESGGDVDFQYAQTMTTGIHL